MNTMFLETGIFSIALVLVIFKESFTERKEFRDCLWFSRLLLATLGILIVDTVGWIIDGKPLFGQVWITTVIDGLDLLLTTAVCWCWVQYAAFIAGKPTVTIKNWYKDFATILLIIQLILVVLSQKFDIYYHIDNAGVYVRGEHYLIHSLISLALLLYSSANCILAYIKEKTYEKKKELLFVALIILLPIGGNIFQLYVYGYPTVWLCMVFMILVIYIHIQNKHTDTERHKQNEVLKEALIKANAASAAKTEFLARMSHDMRTPMNGILGICNLMEDENSVDELKSELPKLKESGDYLLQLINDVLDVNKVESGTVSLHPEVCDEEQIFGSIIAMVKPQMDAKSIDFHFDKINVEWTYMELDVQRVKQIFVNLLTNATKFTPNGGRIDFIMELESKTDNMIRDKFIIRDTGIGISEQFLPNIFKPFAQENRLHEDLGGTGLGLSIVKSLVELMGGTISVSSTIGKGTEFTLYLNFPLAQQPAEDNSDRLTTSKAKSQDNFIIPENLKILLCEDHPLNAEIAMRLLKKHQAKVIWKENGKSGLEEFMNSPVNYFDIILMDIRMPVMDGLAATKNIRALDRPDAKTIPIIAMTANAYDEDVRKSLDAGLNDHIAKPIDPNLMFETIMKWL